MIFVVSGRSIVKAQHRRNVDLNESLIYTVSLFFAYNRRCGDQ